MAVLFLVVFVDLVGFGVIIPLLPFYGEHYGATPAQVGLLMATFSFTQFLAAPVWGRLSDRIGRRPVLITSLAGLAAAYVWLAFADSLTALFAARAVAGVMAGNIGVAFAYAADVTDPANRARGMGLIGAAFSLGFIFGPAIGGILAGPDPFDADYQTPALTAAGFSVLALVLAAAVLPESLSREARARQRALPPARRREQFLSTLLQPTIGLLILLSFLASLVFAGLETTFTMWSFRQFGWGPQQNGYLFAFVGLLSALIQGGLVGRLARRFGERRLIVVGAGALGIGMLLIPFSDSLALLLVAMAIVGIGFSFTSPALSSLISLQSPAETQGGTMGVSRSVTTLARIAGPVWAGALFFFIGKDWPFLGGAAIMMVVAVLAARLAETPLPTQDKKPASGKETAGH